MFGSRSKLLLLLAAAFFLGGPARGQGNFGEAAPDFPPGLFSNGDRYQLSDLRGKVVVLFFYESKCPRCRGSIPERNKVVQALKDKPVKFIAVGASDPMDDVLNYARTTGLAMPIFADSLGLMEQRYGQKISLDNIWQFRVIGPDGKIVGYEMDVKQIEKAAANVEWTYRGKGYHAKLDPAIDCFEWKQYAKGIKLLAVLRKSTNPSVAESANKLYAAVKEEGKHWKAEAEQVAKDNPVQAYDLYTQVATVFAGDELAKSVYTPLQQLAADKAVSSELAARKMFNTFNTAVVRMVPEQRKQAVLFCKSVAKKFPGTPTGEKAAALAKELDS